MRVGQSWRRSRPESIRRERRQRSYFRAFLNFFRVVLAGPIPGRPGPAASRKPQFRPQIAPWKHSSQTHNPCSDCTGGPNTRHVMGRDSYSSQFPVSGSNAGQARRSQNSQTAARPLHPSPAYRSTGFAGKLRRQAGNRLASPLLHRAARAGSVFLKGRRGRAAAARRRVD